MHAEPVTVAVPFYRGTDYLRRAVASVYRQTDTNWRLIVCDDGPDPGVRQLIETGDPRVRYLRNEHNLGMAGNWNRCLEVAETDLVNLLHADDELRPNYVAVMREAASRFPEAAAFFCRAKVIDAAGRNIFSPVDFLKRFLQPKAAGPLVLHGKGAIEALMRGDFIMCPTVCYRRSRLPVDRFRSGWRMVLDLDFFTRLLFAGEMMVGLPEVAYAYRRHPENATTEYTESLLRFEEESRLHDVVAAAARARGWRSAAGVAAGKRVIKFHLLFLTGVDMARGRFGAAGKKWRFLRGIK
jgi:glycosyltransferase involved in cell wall biosynthesis